MKKLDSYIIKSFIRNFCMNTLVIISIFILAQAFRIMKLVDSGIIPKEKLITYILSLLPEIFILTTPITVLLASYFTVSAMASNLEIISMKSSGIKFIRIIRYPLIISLLISFATLYLNHSVYPNSILNKKEIRGNYEIKVEAPIEKKDAFLASEEGSFAYFFRYINSKEGIAKDVEILELNEDFTKLNKIITAKTANYDFENNHWLLNEVNTYDFLTNKEESKEIYIDKRYREEPEKFIFMTNIDVKTRTIEELKELAIKMKNTGGELGSILTELANRYSRPFASVIVSLIGFGLASRYVRKLSGVNIIICIAFGYTYYIIENTVRTFSINGRINPFIGAWIPNIIFLIIGIYFVRKAEY